MQPDEIKALAKEVAEKLGEEAETPLRQIEMMIEHLGEDFVRENLEEALKIESEGGMMVHTGDRRRTPGGVFFFIAKGKMEPDIRQRIFPNFGQTKKGAVVEWHERTEVVPPLKEKPGIMRTVKVTLQGRPGEMKIVDNSVITTIRHFHNDAPYPKGVPHPPTKEPTVYTVFMSMKHWSQVAEAMEKNPKDWLVIDGTMYFDAELETITVFATALTTRELEKQKRQQEGTPQKAENGRKGGKKGEAKQKGARGARAGGKPDRKDRGGRKEKGGRKGGRPAKAPAPPPTVEIEVPEGTPPDVAEKLRQLYSAAETLRARVETMEAKGQAGVAMTRKLLRNTEKQIESIEQQYSKSSES